MARIGTTRPIRSSRRYQQDRAKELFIRDFFRRRRISRHVARHGYQFDFHGLTVRIPENSPLGVGNTLLRNKYEMEEARFVLQHLDPARPVVELGGSISVVSRLIQSRLNAGVKHLVVEANPALLAICSENADRGPEGQADVINAELGYGAARLSFAVGDNIHANRLTAVGDTGKRVIEVPSITLGKLLARLGDTPNYSLVCDIEGGELDLIKTEGDLVGKAALVIMELHPKVYPNGPVDAEMIKERMGAAGFHLVEQINDVCLWQRHA